MKQVYGDCFLSISTVFARHKRVLDERDEVEDDQRSERPISFGTPETIKKVRNLMANDRCVSLRMMTDSLNINKETIRTILHEDLDKTKVCNKFIPHTLSPEQKPVRSSHCKINLFSLRKRFKLLGITLMKLGE
ncbi:FLJ37770-like protein [Trichonephila clavipes]|nr:FLJ37770-like protein [Trichonephila clavipes]